MVAPNAARATPAPATGSFAFTSTKGAAVDTTDLFTATTVTINDDFFAQGSGDGELSSIDGGDNVLVNGGATSATFAVFALGSGAHTIAPFTIAVDGYTLDLTSELTTVRSRTGSGNAQQTSLSIAFIGTISGNGLTDETASTLFNFGQTGGVGKSISYSATAATPNAIDTPEPASMALLGTGLLGMGLIRRRKHG